MYPEESFYLLPIKTNRQKAPQSCVPVTIPLPVWPYQIHYRGVRQHMSEDTRWNLDPHWSTGGLRAGRNVALSETTQDTTVVMVALSPAAHTGPGEPFLVLPFCDHRGTICSLSEASHPLVLCSSSSPTQEGEPALSPLFQSSDVPTWLNHPINTQTPSTLYLFSLSTNKHHKVSQQNPFLPSILSASLGLFRAQLG
jgi:hypothetical protein